MTRDSPTPRTFWTRIVGLLIVLWGWWSAAQEVPFSKHGIETQARIIGIQTSHTSRRTFDSYQFEIIAPIEHKMCTASSTM